MCLCLYFSEFQQPKTIEVDDFEQPVYMNSMTGKRLCRATNGHHLDILSEDPKTPISVIYIP